MPIRLPPLSSLRFFEAVGRHLSFKDAAAELNVTPSAVSHGIVALERALGVDLFVRAPRGLTLTQQGVDYLPYVSEALALIATGMERITANPANRAIMITSAPTFASRWLLPRLPKYGERWPMSNVSVDTSARHAAFPANGFDFAIRMSKPALAGPGWKRLFGELLVPVCSPAYRAALLGPDGQVDLRRAKLIHVTPASEDWAAWLQGAQVGAVPLEGGLRFDTIQLAFEAAIAGLGVAIGRRPMVDQDLAAGLLVEASPQVVKAETAYWLVSSEGASHRRDLVAFRKWLLREAEPFGEAPG